MREFRVGDWTVHRDLNEVVRGETRVRLEPKVMEVLCYLAAHPAEVLPRQKILDVLWKGTFVADEALTRAMTELRRALEDDVKNPRYIQTIPRRGYRLIAPVEHSVAATTPRLDDSAGRRRILAISTSCAAIAVVAVGLVQWLREPAHRFSEGDSVLVARFENRTGEAVFDETLDYWLSRELAESRFVRVASRESIEKTLRLMTKPRDSAIDRTIGREVCVRDGGIRALVVGRVDKIGSRYLLSVDLVDPASGDPAGARTEEAPTKDEVLPAVRRLSGWLRRTLGERLPALRSPDRVEPVTTPSLRVAQLYTQADRLTRRNQVGGAVELLRRCVAEDPAFASAHILLAWCLFDELDPTVYLPPAQRALELAPRTSDGERYFIQGSYYQIAGDYEKAAAAYEALLALHPDHNWGTNNLVFVYQKLGCLCEKLPALAHVAETVRPAGGSADYFIAAGILGCDGDLDTASRFVARTSRSATMDDESGYVWLRPFIDQFPAMKHIAIGQPERALELARVAGVSVAQWIGGEASLYAAVGRLHAAESAPSPLYDLFGQVPFSLLRDDVRGLREALRRLPANRPTVSDTFDVMLLARMGSVAEALKRLEPWKRTGFARELSGRMLSTVEGEIARASGDPASAVRLLREGLERPSIDGGIVTYFLGAESLADLLEAAGKPEEAAEALAKASAHRKSAAFHPFGFAFWLRNHHRLAQLERRLGRNEAAARIEAELRRLLAFADPDHPILAALGAR